ncbi:MAG: GlmU family protein [Bacteroidales bacterium]
MSVILFDDRSWDNLLPLTYTRPVAQLRVGILTVAEKWERVYGQPASWITRPHLREKFPVAPGTGDLLVNGSLLPEPDVCNAIGALRPGEALKQGETLLAVRQAEVDPADFRAEDFLPRAADYPGVVDRIAHPWHIFLLNGQEIARDFERIAHGRTSAPLPAGVTCDNPDRVFVEPGFRGNHFLISTSAGPVYLGRDSEIMEGSLIRGPFALCEGAAVKMGAKIYGPTTLGPYSKAGGEITNSIFLANSNKAHDGYLGNSVLGEWCNLGADTNTSNLKNNYAEVKLWNYPAGRFLPTGQQFCGLIMGDHSKAGINTMFNTGTVVGVSANIFGPGFPRNFIPSFSWGGAGGMSVYRLDKALETARIVLRRRDLELDRADERILEHVFRVSEAYRT